MYLSHSYFQSPNINLGCRAFDSTGTFSEFVSTKSTSNLTPPTDPARKQMITVGAAGGGGILFLIILGCAAYKINKRHHHKQNRNSESVRYSEINSHTTEPIPREAGQPIATQNIGPVPYSELNGTVEPE